MCMCVMLVEMGNQQSILGLFDRYLFQTTGLQFIFTFVNCIYYMFYSDRTHFHLSWLYQDDKYGVVLIYSLLTAIIVSRRLYIRFENILVYLLGEPKQRDAEWISRETFLSVLNDLKFCLIQNTFIVLKALIVGLIFFLHTSAETDSLHSCIHVAAVAVLLIYHLFVLFYIYEFKWDLRRVLPHLMKPLIAGAIYKILSHLKVFPPLSVLTQSYVLGSTLHMHTRDRYRI